MLPSLKTLLEIRERALKIYIERGVFKTEGTYFRQVWRSIREFYTGEIDAFGFIDDFISYIDNQYNRAWRQGAREMGVDPRSFTDDDIRIINERIQQEQEHILRLASDIERARMAGQELAQFRRRAEMWANRYNEVVSAARAHFGGRQLLEWVVGPTEHCDDCNLLNGTVAPAAAWAEARGRGIYPQSRRLQCGGFKCQCSLRPTTMPPTGAIPL